MPWDNDFIKQSGSQPGAVSQAQDFGANGIKSDSVEESTPGAGITIASNVVIEGTASFNIPIYESTDPASSDAVTTAIVDANGGVVITTTAAGNAQTIASPTTATNKKEFIVANNDTSTHSITVNSVVIEPAAAQKYFWDGSAWITMESVAAGSISFTPTGDIAATNVQSAIAELDTEKFAKSTVAAVTGLVKADGAGNISSAVDQTDYFAPGSDLDIQGKYLVDAQNVPDMLAGRGPGYWFDGVDDVVTVANNNNLNFGTGPFSIIWFGDLFATTSLFIVNKATSSPWGGYMLTVSSTGFYSLRIFAGLYSGEFKSNYSAITGTQIICATTDRNEAFIYCNGKKSVSINVSSMDGNCDCTTPLTIGKESINATPTYQKIKTNFVRLFNCNLSEAEVKALSSGAPIPYKYIGASQDELCAFGTFDGVYTAGLADGLTKWASTTCAEETTIVMSGSSQKVTQTIASQGVYVTSVQFNAGKRYRVSVWIYPTTSNGVRLWFHGANLSQEQTFAYTANSWNYLSVELTANTTTTGPVYINGLSATEVFYIDDLSITQVGCVLDLNQSGVGHNTWADTSGNDLHGTVSGALPTNIPASHIQKCIKSVTGNTSFTLPKGYKITSVIAKETAGNALTGGLDMGLTTNGVEIISAMAIGASATVNCTLIATGVIGGTFTTADDTIYISDGDDDANWNGAVVEIHVTMERVI